MEFEDAVMQGFEECSGDGSIAFAEELFGFHAKFLNRIKLHLEDESDTNVVFEERYFINLHHAIVSKILFEQSLNNFRLKTLLNYYIDRAISSIPEEKFETLEKAIDDVSIMPVFEWIKLPSEYIYYNSESIKKLWMLHYLISEHYAEIKTLITAGMGMDVIVTIENFDENAYRRSNPDVDACVATGQFSSGLEHFRTWGVKEGRRMRLSDVAY